MTNKKKPIGKDWEEFVDEWYNLDHNGKIALATKFGVSYDTMKHWVSESGATRKQVKACVPKLVFNSAPNTPTKLFTKPGLSLAVVLGDTHTPYQDDAVLRVVEQFLANTQPDYLVYNGDINDFYQVSDFSKDPSRLGHLQDDVDVTTAMLQRHRELLPKTTILFTEGTHENRWFKYLQDKAPAVSQLRGVSIPTLYKLNELGIQHIPYERGILVNDTFFILHGDIASKHSASTARLHYEKNGGSGVCNHTHRGGSYFKRDRFGTYGWWENFCLCRLDPDWIQNPNWQQGFSVVYFHSDGRFFVEQVPIIGGQFIYNGRLY